MLWWILLVFICIQPLVNGACEKKGVAHTWRNFMCDDFEVLTNFNWWYDWACEPSKYHENDVCTSVIDQYYHENHISMIWGMFPKTNYSCHLGTNTSVILGANEPNHVSQSKLSPQKAAERWPSLEGNATGLPLVSPSAAPCGASDCFHGNTTEWLDAFFSYCTSCRVDYIATHTYWCDDDYTMDFLEMLYNRYGKQIWLTEFACRDPDNDPATVLDFMKRILPRLENATFIAKYAWFTSRIPNDNKWVKTSASLFHATNSTLTELGKHYQNWNCSAQ